ncbi:transposase family protein [Mycobacterium kansasii 732]|uniref:Transposase IS110-like N-terminal domain-containing protein n=1 Tax=Mycobacterium pseudokansasii TaxID=2341080 RepID=A0A498QRK2_9MYCO|nr:transposase family protein [Mycobacterium kansasii 732]VAZ89912.1 hypothetical protein LAUMK35_01055 [Mycobacterium pseudokansasii]VAZ90588.1 hypothetical protein LAUMK21_01055 [Mycobacterium pseudokansasii]VBA47732.1 hypothetical protein LAUMK142_00938 [Mycobacterium pseudokansasii]
MQRGRCPLCGQLLLHAEVEPQHPDEWEQWITATAKAIRHQAIVVDSGPESLGYTAFRLIHTHCRGRHPSSEGAPARRRAGATRLQAVLLPARRRVECGAGQRQGGAQCARTQDVSDATWLADLGAHGLVRASFVPPEPIRMLRDLTRARTTITRARTKEIQRLEKLLEDAGIKLSAVPACDSAGVDGDRSRADIASAACVGDARCCFAGLAHAPEANWMRRSANNEAAAASSESGN